MLETDFYSYPVPDSFPLNWPEGFLPGHINTRVLSCQPDNVVANLAMA